MMFRINGKQRSWYEGMTVADLIRDLDDSHHYAVVRINDTHVSRPHFEKTLIPENSEVFLSPLIAGG